MYSHSQLHLRDMGQRTVLSAGGRHVPTRNIFCCKPEKYYSVSYHPIVDTAYTFNYLINSIIQCSYRYDDGTVCM
jgi:hypothetical protein